MALWRQCPAELVLPAPAAQRGLPQCLPLLSTHSITVTRPPQCLPLLSTHTAWQWQGPHNVCLSCQHTALQWQGPHNVCLSCQHTQHDSDKAPTMSASPVNTQHYSDKAPTMSASPVNTQRYSDKAPTMSASPVNTHSVTVTRPLQCLPLLSTHTALQWEGPYNVCLSCQHTQLYSGKDPTMSASPVNTHSGTVARPPQCLPLLSTHTALQWEGPYNVCLSCQHTQLYSGKAPTMSASPVNTHSCTVARPPQCLPLLSIHTTVQWQAQSETKLRDHLMTVHPVKRFPDKRPPWQTTLMKYYLSLTWWGTNLIKDHPDERLPEFNLARDHPDKRPHWQETTQMRDHPDESTLMKDYLNSPWWWTILTNDHTGERPPWWVYPDERLPEFTLVMDHPDKWPHWWETTPINDHQRKTALN